VAEVRLTWRAEEAIEEILAQSQREFGERARERYRALLERALQDLGEDPIRHGSRPVAELDPTVRTYHLDGSRTRVHDPPGRVGSPRHIVIYRITSDGAVNILGVIHERMLKSRAIRRLLDDER
jgi:toxin ParE1/3/4